MPNERKALILQLTTTVTAAGLFFMPWVLGYVENEVAAWNAWAVAAGLLIAGAMASAGGIASAGWALLAVGLWAILSAVLLGFGAQAGAFWSHIAAGLVALGVSWALLQHESGGDPKTG